VTYARSCAGTSRTARSEMDLVGKVVLAGLFAFLSVLLVVYWRER